MTHQYSQPSDYHFSLDSVQMAADVAEVLKSNHSFDQSHARVLDLCAGVGVIGFELSTHCPRLRSFDFVEVQDAYLLHWEKNVEIVNRPEVQFRFWQKNYQDFAGPGIDGQFDLVICNPPYFRLGQGKMSPSVLKNRSRFMMDSDWEQLWLCLARVLKIGGSAAVLQRSLQDHGFDLQKETQAWVQANLHRGLNLTKIQDVRGTNLLWFVKNLAPEF